MQNLRRQFTEEIAPELRRGAYQAVVAAGPRLLVACWAKCNPGGDDDGCPEVVAAFGAVNQPVDANSILSIGTQYHHARRETKLAAMLGVTPTSVSRCWQEWDAGTNEERAAFVRFVGELLAALPPEDDDEIVRSPQSHSTVMSHVRVAAVSATMLAAIAIAAL